MLTKNETVRVSPLDILNSLALPDSLGTVKDMFRGDPQKGLFIHIQDAHVNEDAQKNIRGIIQFLHERYGLSLVLLEGGEGELDTLYFRSMPDEDVKEKVIRSYLKEGGLSGSEAASIADEFSTIRYFGVEDQRLYNENKRAFLSAVNGEKQILAGLKMRSGTLESQSAAVFSAAVKRFYEAVRKFETASGDLLEYLEVLRELWPLEDSFNQKYPEIGKILVSVRKQETLSRKDSEAAMKGWVRQIERQGRSALPRADALKLGGLVQGRSTGAVTDGEFAVEVKKIFEEAGLRVDIPDFLKEGEHLARSLAEIQGTQLFTELKALEKSLLELLPKSGEEKALLRQLYRMLLLIKLARLELTREEWEELAASRSEWKQEVPGGAGLWSASEKFYKLALDRDKILFERSLARRAEQKAACAVLVTGGFHFEGLRRKFRDSGISYLSIMPAVLNIDDRGVYLDVMRGKSSWMKYFKGSLWTAFVRDFTEKTLQRVSPQEQGRFLKSWRDRIIQNAMREDKITQTARYTRCIDDQSWRQEAIGNRETDLLTAEVDRKFEIFSRELTELWKTGDITPQSLGTLFDRVRRMSVHSSLGADLKLIPGSKVIFPAPIDAEPAISSAVGFDGQNEDRHEMRDIPAKLESLSLLPIVSVYPPQRVVFRMIFNGQFGTFQEETGWRQARNLPAGFGPESVFWHSTRGPISKGKINRSFIPALNSAMDQLRRKSPSDLAWQKSIRNMDFYVFEGDDVVRFYPHSLRPAVGINFETLIGLTSSEESVRDRSLQQFS